MYFYGVYFSARTSFEVEKEPSVAEVEMCQVSILLKVFKHFWVQNLDKDKTHETVCVNPLGP